MFSFFFFPVFDVLRFCFYSFLCVCLFFSFFFSSVFLKFCSSLAHDLFESILLNVEVLGCFYVALLLLICCLIPLWLENILWFKCFLSCWCLFYDPGVVQGIVLSWGLTCPRYLKRNVYCVDKGYVAYGCQLDPVGWWCSGFLVSFSYMYIYSFISYVSLYVC